MASKRRKEYLPMGDIRFKIYHETFDTKRANSVIINPGINVVGPNTKFFNHGEYVALQAELIGAGKNGKDGYGNANPDFVYNHSWRTWNIAWIPGMKRQIEKINEAFKDYQQSRWNAGYEKPDTWPIELFEKLLKAEAILDVYQEELEIVQHWLNY